MWLGRCIKRWAFVEDNLFNICNIALGTERHLAAVVFFRTPNIEARISLVSDLLHARFFPRGKKPGEHNPPELKAWKKLADRMRDLLPFRNLIAHSPTGTSVLHTVGRTPDEDRIEWHFRVAQHLDDMKRKPGKISAARQADLETHYAAVKAVVVDLRELSKQLEVRLK